ncbi:MAG: DUF3108 domain-containing protein [Desulfobacterales bacterium]
MKKLSKPCSNPIAGGILLLFTILLQPADAFADKAPLLFPPGEKLVFDIKWSIIPAGKAVLKVMPIKELDGVLAYHFVFTAETTGIVDYIYKVRDRIDAYADLQMNRSLLYKKKQREGGSKRDILVTFDWEANQARYSNYDKKRNPIPIAEGTFDPLSAFYFTRLFDWENEKIVERPVTDGKKNIIGRARRVKRETIEVPAGRFDTFLYEPDIEHIGGVFEKSKNAKIELWVTADDRRIPVKLRSKVVVGSFTGELVSMEGHDQS